MASKNIKLDRRRVYRSYLFLLFGFCTLPALHSQGNLQNDMSSSTANLDDFVALEKKLHSNCDTCSVSTMEQLYLEEAGLYKNKNLDGYCYLTYMSYERREVFDNKFSHNTNFDDYISSCENSSNLLIKLQLNQVEAYSAMLQRDTITFVNIAENIISEVQKLSIESTDSHCLPIQYIITNTLWNSLLFKEEGLSKNLDLTSRNISCQTNTTNWHRLLYYDHYNKNFDATELLKKIISDETGQIKLMWLQNLASLYSNIEDYTHIEQIYSTYSNEIEALPIVAKININAIYVEALYALNKKVEASKIIDALSSEFTHDNKNANAKAPYKLKYIKGLKNYYEGNYEKATDYFESIITNGDKENLYVSLSIEFLMDIDQDKYSTLDQHLYLVDSIHPISKHNYSLKSLEFLIDYYQSVDPIKSAKYNKEYLSNKEIKYEQLQAYYKMQKDEIAQSQDYINSLRILALFIVLILLSILIVLIRRLKRFKNDKADLHIMNDWVIERAKQMKNQNKERSLHYQYVLHDIRGPLSRLTIIQEQITNTKDKVTIKSLKAKSKIICGHIDFLLQQFNEELANKKTNTLDDKEWTYISDVIMEAELLIDQKLQLPYRIDFSSKEKVYCHKPSLLVILKNLLENSFKYCNQDPLNIKLKVNKSESGVLFSFEDNGSLNKSSTENKDDSYGFGLNICDLTTQKNGGWFKVDKNYKSGFKIDFLLT